MIRSNLLGILILSGYYIIAAGGISLYDHLTSYNREWIRKFYHFIFCFSLFIIFYLFTDWLAALMAIIVISLIAVLVLKLAERVPYLMKLSISRDSDNSDSGTGEVIKQMLYFHSVFILFILLFKVWWPQSNFHALVGIIILGFGDTAAAIVGKFLGKWNYSGILFSSAKTLEGSLSFMVFSFIPAFLLLYFLAGYSIVAALIVASILVLIASFVEALSRKGLDTIIIPLTVALVSVLLKNIFSL